MSQAWETFQMTSAALTPEADAMPPGEKRREATLGCAVRAAGDPSSERADAVVPVGHLWVLA